MKVGDEIVAVDGKGKRYYCSITVAHTKRAEVSINRVETVANHWGETIELAVAPTKNIDRIEWLTEKVVEMGIDRITPLKCAHSERKQLKVERLQKIAVSAMKQSLKTTLPTIDEFTDFAAYVDEPFEGQKFICYCGNDMERRELLPELNPNSPVRVLIGPEGDFSPQEVAMALKAGYVAVALGASRLRTETAGMVAVADIHALRQLKSK
jgi:16S rRNA (uracil1498-N3)-methyltransferase